MKVSYGSARALGLVKTGPVLKMKTLYTMFGERCSFDCAYCAQARTSTASDLMLSRIVWPEFAVGEVVEAVERSHGIERVCLQIVSTPSSKREALGFLAKLKPSGLPVSANVRVSNPDEAKVWFEAGVERLGIATDAIDEKIYPLHRGGELGRQIALLKELSEAFPGRITTHAIIGLGETEKTASEFIQEMYDSKIKVGLFAFTPIRGTKLENRKGPEIGSYRRMQLARYLIEKKLSRADSFFFSDSDEIVGYGIDLGEIPDEAFMTSGCPNCTRPYYNERPGEEPYNFFEKIERTSFTIGKRKV